LEEEREERPLKEIIPCRNSLGEKTRQVRDGLDLEKVRGGKTMSASMDCTSHKTQRGFTESRERTAVGRRGRKTKENGDDQALQYP